MNSFTAEVLNKRTGKTAYNAIVTFHRNLDGEVEILSVMDRDKDIKNHIPNYELRALQSECERRLKYKYKTTATW